jgi:hypothetical protein
MHIKSPNEWAEDQAAHYAAMPDILRVIIAVCAVELCVLFVCVLFTGGNP